MATWDLAERTMEFSVAVFRFCRTLPKTDEARDVARQLRRCASSVGANCRASRRTPSDAAFAAKVSVVIEEADESGFWLELLVRVDLTTAQATKPLSREANEIVAIFTAARKTVQARIAANRKKKKRSAFVCVLCSVFVIPSFTRQASVIRNCTRIVVPFPSPSLSAWTVPPCASTIWRTNQSPRPRPP